MPELIQCPKCNRKLRVPDNLLGKKVKCPSCSTAFNAAAAEEELPTAPLIEEEEAPRPVRRKPSPPPPPEERIRERPSGQRRRPAPPPAEDDDEEETETEYEEEPPPRPRRRRPLSEEYEEEEDDRPRRGKRAAWEKVRTGVTLVLLSLCVMILAAIIYFIGIFAVMGAMVSSLRGGPPAVAPAATGALGGAVALMATVVIMFLGAMVLHVLGEVFCLFAPSKNNAKTLATTALVLSGATILLNVVGLLIGPFLLVAMLTGLGSLFVFLLFLRAVARCLRDWSLEGSAKNLIIMYAATVAGEFILIIMALILGLGGLLRAGGQNAAVPGDGPGAGTYVLGCLGCVEIILGITSFIWYIVLLVQTRNAISHHLSR